MMINGLKHYRCTKCRIFLQAPAFNAAPHGLDGIQAKCKRCAGVERKPDQVRSKTSFDIKERTYRMRSLWWKVHNEDYDDGLHGLAK